MDEPVIKAYLQALISEPVSLETPAKAAFDAELVEFLSAKLTRQKFRKLPLPAKTRANIASKVKISLEQNRPLHLIIPFGSYKHFWNPSYPHVNWAEAFHFAHMINYLSPILTNYEPGVLLEYVSEDMALPRMNNYPPADIEVYAAEFKQLLKQFQLKAPKNLELKYWRLVDKYDTKAVMSEVEGLLPKRIRAWNQLAQSEQDWQLTRAQRSIQWNGQDDLTKLTEPEKKRRVIESRLIELAYFDVLYQPKYLGDYYVKADHIFVAFSWGMSQDNADKSLTLGSVASSSVDFWIGTGILEQRPGGKLVPRIVSQSQFKTIEAKLKSIQTDVKITPGLDSIYIYNGSLSF